MEETSVDRTSSVFIQQDGIDRLKRLLCQAIDAERRYIQDWAVVDIDERIQLLQEAVSIFEKVRPSSTGADFEDAHRDWNISLEAQTIGNMLHETSLTMPSQDPICLESEVAGRADISSTADRAAVHHLAHLRTSVYLHLGCALYDRYRHLGRTDDLDQQLTVHQHMLATLQSTDSAYPTLLRYVGSGLRARFNIGSDRRDVEEALSAHRRALDLCPPGHDGRHFFLRELAESLDAWHSSSGDADILDSCILHHRKALDLRSSRDCYRPQSLHDLAKVLWTQYERVGGTGRLEEAINLIREALEKQLPHHPDRHFYLSDLGLLHWTIFLRDRVAHDIENSVLCHTEALRLRRESKHPDLFKSLTNLALALNDRFAKTTKNEDELYAIQLQREATLCCPLKSSVRDSVLNNLALALLRRGRRLGYAPMIDECIAVNRQTLSLRPEGHQLRAFSLTNLAVALMARQHLGDGSEPIDEPVKLLRAAVELRPPGHPYRHATLQNLQVALSARFEQFFEMSDADESITSMRELLDPASGASRYLQVGTLNNMALLYERRYKVSQEPSDLEAAIDTYRECMAMTNPEDDVRIKTLYKFGDALCLRFKAMGESTDLNTAIGLYEEALKLCDGEQIQPCVLSALAISLGYRFRQTAALDDCNLAMKHHQEAIRLFGLTRSCRSHGLSAFSRLHLIQQAPYFDIATAMRYLKEAARIQSTDAHSRLTEALDVLGMIEDMTLRDITESLIPCSAEVVDAYRASVALLPRVAYIGRVTAARLQDLKKADILAINGATYALAFGQLDAALEMLEEGRAVFWSQALRLRHPVSDVPRDLADDLAVTARQLEMTSTSAGSPHHDNRLKPDDADEEGIRMRRLADHFESLARQVRSIPGLERFLLPPSVDILLSAAVKGPVVVLLASKISCDALLLTAGAGLKHIPLRSMTQEKLEQFIQILQESNSHRRQAVKEQNRAIKMTLTKSASKTGLDSVLEQLWGEVMRPVIDGLGLKNLPLDERPRVWLCPTASFTKLPVHAAWGRRTGFSDYAVPSYTPTVYNLISSRRQFVPIRRNDARVLVAAVPKPRNWQPLPFVTAEVEAIVRVLPSSSTATFASAAEGVEKPNRGASVQSVVDRVHENSILHLACHGSQNSTQPLESGFIMGDGVLTVSRLMLLNLPNAFMAFLSACETAKGDAHQPDQAIHLSAAVMFAGFKSVVGTLWSMGDAYGPLVAETVYSALFHEKDEFLDPDVIPRALDSAVREMRSRKLNPSLWATYIHMGI